jgi:hypothetical protein
MDSEIRMVRKRFKCNKCNLKQSKLVLSSADKTTCENCGLIINEISEIEYQQKTRDQINQNYRLVFDDKNNKDYHHRMDANDKNKRNIYGDTDKKFKSEVNNSSNRNNTNANPNLNSSNTRRTGNTNTNSNSNTNSNNNYRNNNFNSDFYQQPRFEHYNIYNDRGNSFSNRQRENNFNRGGSPPNTNSYNYYSNQQRQRRTDDTGFGFGNIFSNFFGGEENSNRNVNSNNNSRGNNNNNNNNTGGFFTDFFSGFGVPFNESPFMGRISRHEFSDDIFDPGFEVFGSTFNNFFRDNFSSNFRSNYRRNENLFDLFEVLRTQQGAEPKPNPPTSNKTLKSLKRFKMNEKYCKKNEKGKLEYPNCCICLSDINKEEETVLLPCGHLFHWPCVLEWLNKNNTCPVCRFELPPETR